MEGLSLSFFLSFVMIWEGNWRGRINSNSENKREKVNDGKERGVCGKKRKGG